MTTHNHGRVSPFGHPRINAHQATPRGLTQPITSFIGLAYPGIHHAPKNKKHTIFHAQTTKNTKNKTTKKKKQTTTIKLLLFLSHSRPLYSSHTTHHPTNNTQPNRSCFIRGDSLEQQPCCSRHPTACQTTKQTKTQTHFAQTLTTNKAERPQKILASSTPKPHTRSACGTCLHLQTKNLPPPGTNQHPTRRQNKNKQYSP